MPCGIPCRGNLQWAAATAELQNGTTDHIGGTMHGRKNIWNVICLQSLFSKNRVRKPRLCEEGMGLEADYHFLNMLKILWYIFCLNKLQ